MKNQYFGDINDYRKYGLLRKLCGNDITVAVCWMLTPEGVGRDGCKITYLARPDKWRCYDPELFDSLSQPFPGDRNVRRAESAGILSGAVFFGRQIPDNTDERRRYLADFLACAHDSDLVFFDPDNGLDVPSKPRGRKSSPKHLYRDEVLQVWRSNSSILIHQHFPREERSAFIERIAEGIRTDTKPLDVVSFRTANVVFFLIVQPRHRRFVDRAKTVQQVWGDQIQVLLHPARAENTR